jgi:hypothetical protein
MSTGLLYPKSVNNSAPEGTRVGKKEEDMKSPEHEVKIGNGSETRIIMMRHAPSVGKDIIVEGKRWLVLSISYQVPYRIPSMSFIATRQEEAS